MPREWWSPDSHTTGGDVAALFGIPGLIVQETVSDEVMAELSTMRGGEQAPVVKDEDIEWRHMLALIGMGQQHGRVAP
jgi:hypothetical protein